MTREQGPNFSEKHGANAKTDPAVKKQIEDRAKNGEISCPVAFQISEELNITPAEIGKEVDLLNIRLVKCQLGLFGYGPGKKAVKPKSPENDELEKEIRAVLVEARLACIDAWGIAKRLDIPKMAVSNACEALGIKIKPCQLGAF